MREESLYKFAVIVLSILLVVASFLMASYRDGMETQAIERGYALHCPKDGSFAWKGECDVD